MTARGAPSVGAGQKTTASHADSTPVSRGPGVGRKWAAGPSGAARARSALSISPSPAITSATGRASGSAASRSAASTATSLRLCGCQRETQPMTNASGAIPSSARRCSPPSGSGRISSAETTLWTTWTRPGSTPAATTDARVPDETASTASTSRAAHR